MLKFIFAFLMLVHGLIHLMGFAKAFGYGDITQLTRHISKPAGVFWLLAALLLIAATVLLLSKNESWALVSILSVIISQALILSVWKDAKFGTVANIIVLLVAIPALAEHNFNTMVKKEIAAMFTPSITGKTIITKEMMVNLPPIVQHWLIQSGVVGKEKINTVRLKQNGCMLIKPGAKWMPFTATQYFTVDDPGFNWQARVQMMPLVTLNARDRLNNGKGEMLIKILSLIKVANAGGDPKTNESTMLRYLAEICWFPDAALADYITWEALDSANAKATMHYKGSTVSGIFHFKTNGDIASFTANRWYGNGEASTLEKWYIGMLGYQVFGGIRIPGKCEVSWKLKNGDFKWLKLEVVDLEFNQPGLYQ